MMKQGADIKPSLQNSNEVNSYFPDTKSLSDIIPKIKYLDKNSEQAELKPE